MSIGTNISRLRKAMGLTQMRLAEDIGVSFQAVSSWERDEYYPDTENILKLCEVLRTDSNKILGEDDVPDLELKDRLFNEKHMYTFIKSWAVSNGMTQTLRALPFAKEKHGGQFRKGNVKIPYINHPLTMCCNAIALGIKDDGIAAACLLHDVMEDSRVSAEDLPVADGTRQIVELLTKKKNRGKAFDEEGYYREISGNPEASLVKLLDRCNNLSNMAMGFTKAKMAEYAAETETYVMPLLEVIRNEGTVCLNILMDSVYGPAGTDETRCIRNTTGRMIQRTDKTGKKNVIKRKQAVK